MRDADLGERRADQLRDAGVVLGARVQHPAHEVRVEEGAGEADEDVEVGEGFGELGGPVADALGVGGAARAEEEVHADVVRPDDGGEGRLARGDVVLGAGAVVGVDAAEGGGGGGDGGAGVGVVLRNAEGVGEAAEGVLVGWGEWWWGVVEIRGHAGHGGAGRGHRFLLWYYVSFGRH